MYRRITFFLNINTHTHTKKQVKKGTRQQKEPREHIEERVIIFRAKNVETPSVRHYIFLLFFLNMAKKKKTKIQNKSKQQWRPKKLWIYQFFQNTSPFFLKTWRKSVTHYHHPPPPPARTHKVATTQLSTHTTTRQSLSLSEFTAQQQFLPSNNILL